MNTPRGNIDARGRLTEREIIPYERAGWEFREVTEITDTQSFYLPTQYTTPASPRAPHTIGISHSDT